MTTTDRGLNKMITNKKTGKSRFFFILKDIDKAEANRLLKIHAKNLSEYDVLYQNFSIFENSQILRIKTN